MSILLLRTLNDAVISTLAPLPIKEDSASIISPLISEQFPEFIKIDHPRLVTFVEAYYEWMEQKNKTLYSTFVLQDFSDIDSTVTEFIKHFKSQYLDKFPEILAYDHTTKSLVNEKTLLKRIRDFYRAKGTEKAYKLLFRILYDANIDGFYYPREDIMKVSSGKWTSNKSIKTSFTHKDNIWDTLNTTIVQKNNVGDIYATAIVKNILKYETNTTTVAEIFVDEINGTFIIDEVLTFNGGNTNEFSENVQSVIEKIYITSNFEGKLEKGTGYKIGDKIEVITATGGTDAIGEVAEVDGLGGIVSVDMLNSGIGYKDTDNITFTESSFNGTGAGITASIGAVSLYPGYYLGTQGQLSSNKKLFDNDFYQEFSYEIRSELSLSSYKDAILDLIHPAGTKFFNMLFLKKSHPVYTKYKTSGRPLEVSVLGHYTPYNWRTTENLRYNSQGVDLYPFGYNPSGVTADESGTQGHTASIARSGIWWGQTYNDYAGRTAQSDTDITGMTHSYVSGVSGGTWDAGTTGPLWYLSKGVFFTAGTAGASAAYDFVGTADAGDFDNSGSYWVIYPHPNIRGISTIPLGCSFAAVELQPFFFELKDSVTAGIDTEFSTIIPT